MAPWTQRALRSGTTIYLEFFWAKTIRECGTTIRERWHHGCNHKPSLARQFEMWHDNSSWDSVTPDTEDTGVMHWMTRTAESLYMQSSKPKKGGHALDAGDTRVCTIFNHKLKASQGAQFSHVRHCYKGKCTLVDISIKILQTNSNYISVTGDNIRKHHKSCKHGIWQNVDLRTIVVTKTAK